jgi:hypothetical protein
MEMSGQLHSPDHFTLGMKILVSIGYGTVWAPVRSSPPPVGQIGDWVDFIACLDATVKRNAPCQCRESNSDPFALQPIAMATPN